MAVFPVLIAPHALLKKKAQPVAQVDDEVKQLMDDMLETMYASKGIGLAANQIGVLRRVIVVDVQQKEGVYRPFFMANPVIEWYSEETANWLEGCLSFPEQYVDIERSAEIRVRWLDRNNEEQEIKADGLLSVCIQHELDHLDGINFVDHVSYVRKTIILNKLRKMKKERMLLREDNALDAHSRL